MRSGRTAERAGEPIAAKSAGIPSACYLHGEWRPQCVMQHCSEGQSASGLLGIGQKQWGAKKLKGCSICREAQKLKNPGEGFPFANTPPNFIPPIMNWPGTSTAQIMQRLCQKEILAGWIPQGARSCIQKRLWGGPGVLASS